MGIVGFCLSNVKGCSVSVNIDGIPFFYVISWGVTFDKNILVTGVSILEGIFLYLANIHQLGKPKSRQFANLIDYLRKNPDILDMGTDIYDTLDEIRDLRNRIHLAARDAESEAVRELDYNNYTDERRELMERTLYQILTCKAVSNNPDLFDFLKPSSQQNLD